MSSLILGADGKPIGGSKENTKVDKKLAAAEKIRQKQETMSPEKRAAERDRKRQTKVASQKVLHRAKFWYLDPEKSIELIPIDKVRAFKLGITIEDELLVNVTGGRATGVSSIKRFKGKPIRVSYGFQFVERKVATKGTARGANKSKKSAQLRKKYVRRWITIRVPLDADNLDIINWVKAFKKPPEILEIGEQQFLIKAGAKQVKQPGLIIL